MVMVVGGMMEGWLCLLTDWWGKYGLQMVVKDGGEDDGMGRDGGEDDGEGG